MVLHVSLIYPLFIIISFLFFLFGRKIKNSRSSPFYYYYLFFLRILFFIGLLPSPSGLIRQSIGNKGHPSKRTITIFYSICHLILSYRPMLPITKPNKHPNSAGKKPNDEMRKRKMFGDSFNPAIIQFFLFNIFLLVRIV